MKGTKARLEAAALFLVVFLLGITFGALGDHIWSQRVSGEPAAINTNPTRNEVMQDLTERLELTPEQQKQIGAAIDDTRAKWQALYSPLDGQREAIRQEGRAKIRAALTPAQQVKFDEFLKRLDEQRRRKEAEKQPAH
jgi:Spy/CpxP family protein refolding chaperone